MKSARGNTNLLLVVAVLLAVVAAGYFWLQSQQTPSQPQTSPASTLTLDPLPIPPTDPQQIENWETYTNSSLNFTLRYPSEWELGVQPDESTVHLRAPGTRADHGLLEGALLDIVSEQLKGRSLEQVVESAAKYYPFSTTSQHSVDNKRAILLSVEKDPQSGQTWKYDYIYVEDNGLVITLAYAANGVDLDENSVILDQILSTFEFVE